MFKKGDKVIFKSGLKERFRVGSFYSTNFIGGITGTMVDFINEGNELIINSVGTETITFRGSNSSWDKRWFTFEKKKEFIEASFIVSGDKTLAVIGDKVGRSVKSPHDEENRKVGILIATMRALQFDDKDINNVVDVLFDGMPELKDYSATQLVNELARRI